MTRRMAMSKTKRKAKWMVVIVFVLQGHPKIIIEENLEEPKVWPSMSEALDFTMSGHMGLMAAEQILVIDCKTGETEVL